MAKGKYEYWLTDEGLTLLEGWARDGLIDEQIAHNCGITAKTLYEWKNKFSVICEALKKGKEIVDLEVENALLKRAKGFHYDEKTYERVWNEKLEKYIKVNTKTVTKMVVPDVGAQAFWLKNRRPDKWRDKPVEDGQAAEQADSRSAVRTLTTEELRKLASQITGDEK